MLYPYESPLKELANVANKNHDRVICFSEGEWFTDEEEDEAVETFIYAFRRLYHTVGNKKWRKDTQT